MATYYVDGAVGSDSNAGTSAGAGNAWLTIAHALATIAAGDIVYVKASAIYSIGTGLTFTQTTAATCTRLVGYTTTPGDNGRATIKATAAIVGLTISGYGWRVENFVIDGDSTGTTGVYLTGILSDSLVECLVKNWTVSGLELNVGSDYSIGVTGVEVTACTGSYAVYMNSTLPAILFSCNIHDNTGIGVYIPAGAKNSVIDRCTISGNGVSGVDFAANAVSIRNCKIYGNTGRGIWNHVSGLGYTINGNTIHGNGGDGLTLDYLYGPNSVVNNIFTSNGGYGISASDMSPATVDPLVDYNWFGSGGLANTSGARNIILAGPHDLSGDPQYVDAGAGDFTPQNVAVKAGYP